MLEALGIVCARAIELLKVMELLFATCDLKALLSSFPIQQDFLACFIVKRTNIV